MLRRAAFLGMLCSDADGSGPTYAQCLAEALTLILGVRDAGDQPSSVLHLTPAEGR